MIVVVWSLWYELKPVYPQLMGKIKLKSKQFSENEQNCCSANIQGYINEVIAPLYTPPVFFPTVPRCPPWDFRNILPRRDLLKIRRVYPVVSVILPESLFGVMQASAGSRV